MVAGLIHISDQFEKNPPNDYSTQQTAEEIWENHPRPEVVDEKCQDSSNR